MAAWRFSACAALLALIGIASRAAAQDTDVDPFALQVHGFASQGFLVTTANDYLAKSEHGSFELTEVGINFTKPLTDKLRVGFQLFSRKVGPTGNYSVKFDWFYLDYHWQDWLSFRAGRVKLPFGLYNETSDIDAARVPILLPQSVYPIQNRDFLLAQSGAELYGRAVMGGAGALDYRLYGGTIFLDNTAPPPGSPFTVGNLNVPYLAGTQVLWETPLQGLRAGGSLQILRLDTDLHFDPMAYMPLQAMGRLPAGFDGTVRIKIPAVLWVGSIEYSANDLSLAAEYSRWHVDIDSNAPALYPGPMASSKTVSERMYGLATYRVSNWLQPGIYYSLFFPNVDHRSGRESMQHDVAATLRFDINEHWLVKLEGHYMNGTAALNVGLNANTPLAALTRSWALFLVKTTAYF